MSNCLLLSVCPTSARDALDDYLMLYLRKRASFESGCIISELFLIICFFEGKLAFTFHMLIFFAFFLGSLTYSYT